MFSVCLCSFIFIMSSSIFGMPISGTHTVIGALIGAGIVAIGADEVSWTRLGSIMVSWVVSPLLSGIISFILVVGVATFTLKNSQSSYRQRLLSQQLVSSICFMILSYLADSLFNHKTGIP